jgi:hypothetical protein
MRRVDETGGNERGEREPAALKVATQNHVSNQGAGLQIQQRKEQISAADSSTDVTLSRFLFFNNNLIDKSKLRGHNGNQELHCSRPVSLNVNSVSPRMKRMNADGLVDLVRIDPRGSTSSAVQFFLIISLIEVRVPLPGACLWQVG